MTSYDYIRPRTVDGEFTKASDSRINDNYFAKQWHRLHSRETASSDSRETASSDELMPLLLLFVLHLLWSAVVQWRSSIELSFKVRIICCRIEA